MLKTIIKHLWLIGLTAVSLLMGFTACGAPEETAVPEITGPALILFYTDN